MWGAGAHTARAWLQQGHRTLDDLRTKASLTRQQKIGLKYYYDLLDRMPREEAAEIEAKVGKYNCLLLFQADIYVFYLYIINVCHTQTQVTFDYYTSKVDEIGVKRKLLKMLLGSEKKCVLIQNFDTSTI